MHTLRVTLKQHTPLIHFQHDQDGATLRASEVKPKLDKFILSKLTQEEHRNGEKEGWIKSKSGNTWLDYKMRIEAEGAQKEYLLASYIKKEDIEKLKRVGIDAIGNTAFFAQEKQKSNILNNKNPRSEWNKIDKKGLFTEDSTVVTIISGNQDAKLTEIINANIQCFFVAFNFGTRQSKGFGCFSVSEVRLNGTVQSLREYEELLKEEFPFVCKKETKDATLSSVLSIIKKDYQLLKSGDNPQRSPSQYKKSLLFCYAIDRMQGNPRWEKRFFKKNLKSEVEKKGYHLKSNKNKQGGWNEPIKDSDGNQGWKDTSGYNYNYIRAVLGLAEQFEFRLTGKTGATAIVKVNGGEELQRFKSPLLFKVFGNLIYLVGNEPTVILDKKVDFSYRLKEIIEENEIKKDVETELEIDDNAKSLSIPKEFSLADFMSYASSKIGYCKIK